MNIDINTQNDEKLILIVEDDMPDAVLLQKQISTLWPAAKIINSKTTSCALQALSNYTFNLIILDLNLSDSHGPNTVATIRKMNKDTPIFVLTNMANDLTIEECIKHGANYACIKSKIMTDQFHALLQEHAIT